MRNGSRTYEHSISDKQSAIYKHARSKNIEVSQNGFRIVETGFHNTVDRKIAEALYINDYKPEWNEHIKSHQLHLFN